MTIPYREARRQLEQFFSALFLPDELIEIRLIESWVSRRKKRSRVVRAAQWLQRDALVSQHREMTGFARRERANVYFGVCPRPRSGDAQDDRIQTVRCLWCDIDNVTAEEAFDRWSREAVPSPSIIVSSGSGIHGYWLLQRDLRSREERALVAAMLPHFYRSFGGDHVQNLSRVMRLPGTVNCKEARNGRQPRLCVLCACQPELRYPLEAFSEWIDQAEQQQRQRRAPSVSSRTAAEVSTEAILARTAEAAALARQLGKPARDRSRRDFAITCDLLRLGLTGEEIWPLVCDSSKFESNGRPYFDVTIANAERSILLDQSTAGPPETPA
jgi:hypothetical protein